MSQPVSFAPPPGPPPPSSYANVPPPDDEPPPPYTAKPVATNTTHLSPDQPRFKDLSSVQSLNPTQLPLDPPPDCFSTPTPARIRSHSFAPFRVPSREQSLATGFRSLYAIDELQSHGISEADWLRFTQDLGTVARMSAQGLSLYRNSSLSHTLRLGTRAGTAYDAAFAKTPMDEVQDLIQVWNESAFQRRKLRVTLRQRLDARGIKREGYELLVEAL